MGPKRRRLLAMRSRAPATDQVTTAVSRFESGVVVSVAEHWQFPSASSRKLRRVLEGTSAQMRETKSDSAQTKVFLKFRRSDASLSLFPLFRITLLRRTVVVLLVFNLPVLLALFRISAPVPRAREGIRFTVTHSSTRERSKTSGRSSLWQRGAPFKFVAKTKGFVFRLSP